MGNAGIPVKRYRGNLRVEKTPDVNIYQLHRNIGGTESKMTRRRGDKTPEPAGGRAAQRLRMFEEARRPKEVFPGKKKSKSAKLSKKDAPLIKGVPSGEK